MAQLIGSNWRAVGCRLNSKVLGAEELPWKCFWDWALAKFP